MKQYLSVHTPKAMTDVALKDLVQTIFKGYPQFKMIALVNADIPEPTFTAKDLK